jgi:hypothetical protein
MAIGSTGFANLGAEWTSFLRDPAIVRDVVDVNDFAQQHLQRLYAGLIPDAGAVASATDTTFFHWRFERSTDRMVRYTYRSRDGFAPDRGIDPVFRLKPSPDEVPAIPETLDEFVELAKRSRAHQEALPPENRTYIGGDLIFTRLENGRSHTFVGYRWDDYDDMWWAMRDRAARGE